MPRFDITDRQYELLIRVVDHCIQHEREQGKYAIVGELERMERKIEKQARCQNDTDVYD